MLDFQVDWMLLFLCLLIGLVLLCLLLPVPEDRPSRRARTEDTRNRRRQ